MSATPWPLIGHIEVEAQFIAAVNSEHLHHGWLLEGPSGIGKAILARRMAAKVLGAREVSPESLDTSEDDPVIQKIIAESHPDYRWISRRADDKGKIKQDIPVDDIRSLNQFFSLKSGLGGWRVGVIDSIDELNRNGANALLKTLEEPPPNSLLILVSHGTRPVLPTIKSRCRTLRLNPLNEDETLAALKLAKASDPRSVARVSRGRPGLGLALSTAAGLAASNAVRSYLRAMPKPSDSLLSQVVSTAGVDPIAFDAFTAEISDWLQERAAEQAEYAMKWLSLSSTISEVRALNMDRFQAVAKITARLQAGAHSV